MSKTIKTVNDANDSVTSVITNNFDPLYQKQRDDVAAMRSSLLQCNSSNDSHSVMKAMKNITVMRIYHELARVIKFLEEMDKLEDKMYSALDNSLDNMSGTDPKETMVLLNIQTQLIQNMVTSQKLLEPYTKMMDNIQDYVVAVNDVENDTSNGSLIPQESRIKVRDTAASILTAIDKEMKAS